MLTALRGDPYVRRMFSESIQGVLEQPDEGRIFAVDWGEESVMPSLEGLLHDKQVRRHRSTVFGSVALDAKDRDAVVSLLYRAAALPDVFGAACEIPHHALLMRKGAARVAVSICFMCNRLTVLTDDGCGAPVGKPSTGTLFADLDARLHRLLNDRLARGGVVGSDPAPNAK